MLNFLWVKTQSNHDGEHAFAYRREIMLHIHVPKVIAIRWSYCAMVRSRKVGIALQRPRGRVRGPIYAPNSSRKQGVIFRNCVVARRARSTHRDESLAFLHQALPQNSPPSSQLRKGLGDKGFRRNFV